MTKRIWVSDHYAQRPKKKLPPPSSVNILYREDGLFVVHNHREEMLTGVDAKTPITKPDDMTRDQFAEYLTDARQHAFWVAGTNGDPCIVCMPVRHRYNQEWANGSNTVPGKAVQKAASSQKNTSKTRITEATSTNILYGDGSVYFRHDGYNYPLEYVDNKACKRPSHITEDKFAKYLTDPNRFTLWIDGTQSKPCVIFMPVTHGFNEMWANESNMVAGKAVHKASNSNGVPDSHGANRSSQGASPLLPRKSYNAVYSRVSDQNIPRTKKRIIRASPTDILYDEDGGIRVSHGRDAYPLRYVDAEDELVKRPAHVTAKQFAKYLTDPEQFTFWIAGTNRDPCVIFMPVNHKLNGQWLEESARGAGRAVQRYVTSQSAPSSKQPLHSASVGSSRQAAVNVVSSHTPSPELRGNTTATVQQPLPTRVRPRRAAARKPTSRLIPSWLSSLFHRRKDGPRIVSTTQDRNIFRRRRY